MKRVTAITVALVLLFTLITACGGGSRSPSPTPTPAPAPAPAPRSEPEPEIEPETEQTSESGVNIGDIIDFGGLEWLILDISDDKALILSKEVLDNQEYYSELHADITWEDSDIRQYLNEQFYDDAFTPEEQMLIMETQVTNDDNPEHGTPGGNDTTDKIFLLSIDEATQYFPDDSARVGRDADGMLSAWMLRSPGMEGSVVARIYTDGPIDYDGALYNHQEQGVRPAMWIDLSGLAELSVPHESTPTSDYDWKQFLQDYEDWMNDYIDFMEKYNEDPTNIEFLTEYLELLEKMGDWAERAEEIEEDLANNPEALKDYLETLSRIIQRLSEIG